MFDWAAVGFWQRLRRGSHSSRRDSLSSPETSRPIRPVCVETLWKCRETCWDFVCLFMFLHKFIQSVFCFEWPWESLWLPWQALEEFPEQTHQTTTSTSINIRDTQTAKEVSSVPLTVNGGRVFRPEVWTIEVDWTRLLFLKMAVCWVMLTGTLLSTVP